MTLDSAAPEIHQITPPMVLVVDDSASMREGIASIIRHLGYRVETAENGRAGYAKAQSVSPDLILSDLEMPIANGFELLASVRSDARLAMVPFIMITGVADRSSTRRAMELGADDYLTKPFTPDEVIATVRGRLNKQQNWRQATAALAATYSQGMMNVLPHEFRTPLNSILGFAELMSMMAERGLSPTQTREFADTIQRAGKTLLSHTTRFLTLMELQSLEAAPAGTTSVMPSEICEQINRLLSEQLPSCAVTADIDIEQANLRCPSMLLQTLVRELTGNALKFADPNQAIHIRGAIKGAYYEIAIDNAGRPFPIDRLQQIGAFVQFDRDHHEQQGLGIGLAIVSHACRLAKARFHIQNLPPRTVRVTLQLPIA